MYIIFAMICGAILGTFLGIKLANWMIDRKMK
jgi:flagellar motor component MotA